MNVAKGVPPSISGYSFLSWLGGGGFADVFLYEEQTLTRRVAVKVLRENVDDPDLRRLFTAEANLMATLSTHPNIVTIYSAGVATDRRPYLVMEYYPLEHYGERVKRGPLHFQEVLAVGVKIACAVETAHQARIVHRDIKPANILASDFGQPGLTDFGISAAQGDDAESFGFTPAYAPPEVLADTSPGDARSDVYSLAASLWAMLAGHAPFERRDHRSTRGELIARGLNELVPPLPAGAAPPALERVLRQALEKDPARRPATAHALATMLQAVEQEAGFRQTPLVLMHDHRALDSAVAEVVEAVEATKKGRGVVVDLNATAAGTAFGRTEHDTLAPRGFGGPPMPPLTDRRTTRPTAAAPSTVASPIEPLPIPAAPPAADTTSRRGALAEPAVEPEAPAQSPGFPKWLWAAAGLLVVGLVAVLGSVVIGGSGEDARPDPTLATGPLGPVPLPGDGEGTMTLEVVSGLTAARTAEGARFSWLPSMVDGVTYQVQRVDSGHDDVTTVETAEYVIAELGVGERPCVRVLAMVEGVVVADDWSTAACVP